MSTLSNGVAVVVITQTGPQGPPGATGPIGPTGVLATFSVVGPATITLNPGQWALCDVTAGNVVLNVSSSIAIDQKIGASVVAPTGGGPLPHTCTLIGPAGVPMQDPNSPNYFSSVQITTPVTGYSWQRGANGALNLGV